MILRKHWITGLVTFCVVLACSIVLSGHTPKSYSASTELLVSLKQSQSSENSRSSDAVSYLNLQTRNYAALAMKPTVLQPVIDDLGLDMTVDDLADTVTSEVTKDTTLIVVTANESDPELAADVANAIGNSLSKVAQRQSATGLYDIVVHTEEAAQVPTTSDTPSQKMVIAAGVFAALMLGIVVELIAEACARRFGNARKLVDYVKEPVIDATGHEQTFSSIKKIVNRLAISAPRDGADTRFFMLVPANEHESITKFVMALASDIAEHHHVLLIDAALRSESLSDLPHSSDRQGLTNVLAKETTIDQVIRKYDHGDVSMDVIGSGPMPMNIDMLFSRDAFASLYDQLAGRYDYVVIRGDVPEEDSKGLFAMEQAGSDMLAVVRKNQARREDIDDIIYAIHDNGSVLSGFVFID